jgi:hypothetical protein
MAKTKPAKDINPASTSSPDSDSSGVPNTHSATYNHTSVGVKAPKESLQDNNLEVISAVTSDSTPRMSALTVFVVPIGELCFTVGIFLYFLTL